MVKCSNNQGIWLHDLCFSHGSLGIRVNRKTNFRNEVSGRKADILEAGSKIKTSGKCGGSSVASHLPILATYLPAAQNLFLNVNFKITKLISWKVCAHLFPKTFRQ